MARESYFHAQFRMFCSKSRKSDSNATCFDLEKLGRQQTEFLYEGGMHSNGGIEKSLCSRLET